MKKYRTDFTEEELKRALNVNEGKAKELVENPEKWDEFKKKLDSFIHKAYKIPVLGGLVDDVVSMIQMVDSYVKGDYRDIPLTSVISAVAALIYLLSPIDLIPDAIPVIGYIDDAAVILLVLKLGVGHDLEKYKSWQENNRLDAISEMEITTGKLIIELLGDDSLGAILLCSNNKLRILAVPKDLLDVEEKPYIAKVHYLNVPVDILSKMYIESENDYLEFLNGIISKTAFIWSPIGKLSAIHEADYDRYEEYFALTERYEENERNS